MKYDIIGDIHGHADQLVKLLKILHYDTCNVTYRHSDPERKAVFVGDFIDRGPKIRETLSIVKSMVDNKAAYAVLGNHEYNALCFHTLKDGSTDSWLRPRNDKNIKQHLETLYQFRDYQKEWDAYLSWFLALPLFLDLGDLRIVHAAWIPLEINKILKWTFGNKRLSDILIQKSAQEGSEEFKTVEKVLKGVELGLPRGAGPFYDKDGHSRNEIRIKWWEPSKGKTYEEILFPRGNLNNLGGHPILNGETEPLPVYEDSIPVFFGHYWLDPTRVYPPQIQTEQICCLDYSVAKNGLLVAYQWEGERRLKNDHFVWV